MSESKVCLQHRGYNVDELFSSFSFEVPIYQRVFTWEDEQFERLFNDLRDHFCSSERNGRYYLGVITVVRRKDSDKLALVDGQQRLTCILLLGAFLDWNLDTSKLTYAARPGDEEALKRVYSICKGCNFSDEGSAPSLDQIASIGNDSMSGFLRYALTTGKQLIKTLWEKRQDIKRRLTLMVSFLPDTPYKENIFEQNRYFEKMNYGGKQLEPQEILKVRMCAGLDGKYISIWNSVSNFGKCHRFGQSKNGETFDKHSFSLCDAMGNDDDENFLVRIYGQHNEKQKLLNRFKEQYRQYEMGTEERDDMRLGLISFQTFLLHVRYLYLKEAKKAPIIGDESHLLELFGELVALSPEVRGEIINLMEKYRQFLDSKIIHVWTVEGEQRYAFYVTDDDGVRDSVPDERKDMLQFQSMLYVSSGPNQKWILDAYGEYCKKPGVLSLDCLKQLLKKELLDDKAKAAILESKEWPDDFLSYGTENRKWLALLDYLLWERFLRDDNYPRCEGFVPEIVKSAIQNYVFRKNRSVEHLHAQTDTNAVAPGEWERSKDIFGNLALISAGKNSEYGNLSVGGKFERVVKLLNEGGVKGSRIESIKLLFMLAKCNGKDVEWTPPMASQHANDMLNLFKQFLTTNSIPSISTSIQKECRPADLSDDINALGEFIEQNFFGGKLPSGYSMSVVNGNDAEAPNEWCGRYFKIAHGEINVRAWVGWLYGVDDYKESPKFVIQLAKKDFHTLPGSGKSGWYLDSFWGKWMEKGLSNNLSDMIAIAQKFQHEMESLCTSD